MAEQFSNFARTTLANAIAAGATSLTVTDATYFPQIAPFRIAIDKEVFYVTALAGNVFTVTPGYEGSAQAAHNSGANVLHGLTAGLEQQLYAALTPTLGRQTTGNTTLLPSDEGTSLQATDSTPVTYILPAGLPGGFRCRSYQAGAGQISYVAGNGASILDGALRSLGPWTSGYYVDLENVGNDQWLVLGNTTTGLLSWTIVGQQKVREGDTASLAIWRPDSTNNFPQGVSLKVDGTGFASAGFSQNLVQALTSLAILDPNVTFDGVDTLTILPAARNPLPLTFFAVPTYTAIGNRSVTTTISNPSTGSIANASVTTQILNTSKPTTPDLVLPSVSQNTSGVSAGSQNQITLASTAGLATLMTVVASNIPAQTWITGISGNIITLSGNLTGSIADSTPITFKPPGIWFDFSTSAGMTFGTGSKVSAVTDKLNGYQAIQSTATVQPSFTSSSLNGLGGLTFSGSSPGNMLTATAAPIVNLLDGGGQKLSLFVVAKTTINNSFGVYCEFSGSLGQFVQNGGSSLAFAANGLLNCVSFDVSSAQAVGNPYIWHFATDGNSGMIRTNGQRRFVPATLTADYTSSTATMQVDDSTDILAGMTGISSNTQGLYPTQPYIQGVPYEMRVSSVADGTHVTMNQRPTTTIPAGTTLYFYNQPAITTRSQNPHSATALNIGGTGTPISGSSRLTGIIYELIVIPRVLSPQEWRGITLYLANKWGVGTPQTVNGGVSAGAYAIALNSTTGICPYQTVNATTGIAGGSTVVKVNPSTNVITLDTPVTSAGLTNGQTLTFTGPSFKQPALLDISQYAPTFFDGFANGAPLANSGLGWQPYLGNVSFPGQFAGGYGAAGHGSSDSYNAGNSPSGNLNWFLDVLNWQPWLKYNPFGVGSPADAASGEAVITASPTNPAIANLIGYNPPQPLAYPYTSGLIQSSYFQQYGYYETRIKTDNTPGAWPAFWMLAADGTYPPELDIFEGYGATCGLIYNTLHGCSTFTETDASYSVSPNSDLQVDWSREYMLIGAEVNQQTINFYVNRELIWTCGTPWDFSTPLFMLANLGITGSQGPGVADQITPINHHMDFIGAYKKVQNPTIPTGTQVETTALLAAMNVQPVQSRINLINTLIASLKSFTASNGMSLWNTLDFFYMVAAHDVQAGRINWKNPAQVGTVVGSPVFTTDRGYVGSNGASYIDTGIALATAGYQLTATNSHIGAVGLNLASNNGILLGSPNYSIEADSGGTLKFNPLITVRTATIVSGNGHYVATRNQSHFAAYRNGVIPSRAGLSFTPSNGVQPLDTQDMLIANGASQVACVHGGAYFSPDDVAYLYQIIFPFLHTLGAL